MANTEKSLKLQEENNCLNPKISPLPFVWNRLAKLTFDDSPTDYIALCRCLTKLNDIVEEVNDFGEALENFFNWLQTNFDNWITEKVNNKLNEWLEDGTLQALISEKLNLQLTFDTTEEMLMSVAPQKGNKVRTLGYSSINDGGGALFYITDQLSDEDFQFSLGRGLYATLSENNPNPLMMGANISGINAYHLCQKYIDIMLKNNNKVIDLYGLSYQVSDDITNKLNHQGLYVDKPCTIKNGTLKLIDNSKTMTSLLCLNNTETGTYIVDNITFDGNYSAQSGTGSEDGGKHGIYIGETGGSKIPATVSDVIIKNCTFKETWSYNICALDYNIGTLRVENCQSKTKTIFINEGYSNTLVKNCYVEISDNKRSLPTSLLHNEMELSSQPVVNTPKKTVIDNCTLTGSVACIMYKIDARPQYIIPYDTIRMTNNTLKGLAELFGCYSPTNGLTVDHIFFENNLTYNTTTSSFVATIDINKITAKSLTILGETIYNIISIYGEISSVFFEKIHLNPTKGRLRLHQTSSTITINSVIIDEGYADGLLQQTSKGTQDLLNIGSLIAYGGSAPLIYLRSKQLIIGNLVSSVEVLNAAQTYTENININGGLLKEPNGILCEQYNNSAPIVVNGLAYTASALKPTTLKIASSVKI